MKSYLKSIRNHTAKYALHQCQKKKNLFSLFSSLYFPPPLPKKQLPTSLFVDKKEIKIETQIKLTSLSLV
jgi:hypothetical protein